MSALTVTWPCTHCDAQVPLPAHVTSTDPIHDDAGKTIGVTLVPHVDTTPALTHLVDTHLVTDAS